MKKLLSKKDEDELFNQTIDILMQKKCTLGDFDKLSAKAHEFCNNNALLGESVTTNYIDIVHQN